MSHLEHSLSQGFKGEKEHFSFQVMTMRDVCIENKLCYLFHQLPSFTRNKAAHSAENQQSPVFIKEKCT